MSRKQPARRKRRTREHIIADLSVNFVERQALLSGFSVQRFDHDYGIDLWITTHDPNGEVEPGDILVQLKATDHLNLLADGQTIAMRVKQEDYRRWLMEMSPVILVVYDAQGDTAHWLYVQAHFSSQTDLDLDELGATMTLHLPVANRVDTGAMRTFAGFRDAILAQMKGVRHRE